MVAGCALIASLPVLAVLTQYPVHRTHRAQMDAALEQTLIDLARRLVAELFAVEDLAHALALLACQGSRLMDAMTRGACRSLFGVASAPCIEATAMDQQCLTGARQRNRLDTVLRKDHQSSFPFWT